MSNRGFDGYMTPEIAAQLREIGAIIDAPATAAIYAPLHDVSPSPEPAAARDVRYADHERNVLDVFSRAAPGDAVPVVVFIHGGGFERGAKHTPGSPFYDNIMHWAVANGYVGVNVNYRLAPEHVWPSGIEDIDAVIGWLEANIGEYGGDARKVFLWGHSAGAAHVADYLAERAREGRDDCVAGAILLSGFYDLGPEVSMWKVYYGDDVSNYSRRASLPGLLATGTPLFVVDAELDPPWAQEQAAILERALEGSGAPLQRLHLAGHSHLSEAYAVGTSDRSLTGPVDRFLRATLSAD
jgi:triacylglycerol lipase